MPLTGSIVGFAVLGSLGVLAARLLWLRRLRRRFRDPLPEEFPYQARRALLTPTELDFNNVLERNVGRRYTICMKVRLADVIDCPGSAWRMGYGRLIAQKHLDFVLIDPATTRIRAAIELDDRTHRLVARRARDRFVEAAMRAAGSVAWVKTKDYWQDRPGWQSMRLNFDLVRRGLRIERIVILRNHLWPAGERMPSPEIRPWIKEQHDHGIWVLLVRESDIAGEPDLLADFGIYGERATGVQELDDQSRTLRFILYFAPQNVRLARDRWTRLLLYTTSFADLLDQTNLNG